MARFELSQAAERDLREIRDHLASDSLDAAERVLARMHDAFLALAKTPGVGHRRRDLTDADLRFWTVYPYLVVYDASTEPIGVARIFHGSRDVERALRSIPGSRG